MEGPQCVLRVGVLEVVGRWLRFGQRWWEGGFDIASIV